MPCQGLRSMRLGNITDVHPVRQKFLRRFWTDCIDGALPIRQRVHATVPHPMHEALDGVDAGEDYPLIVSRRTVEGMVAFFPGCRRSDLDGGKVQNLEAASFQLPPELFKPLAGAGNKSCFTLQACSHPAAMSGSAGVCLQHRLPEAWPQAAVPVNLLLRDSPQ